MDILLVLLTLVVGFLLYSAWQLMRHARPVSPIREIRGPGTIIDGRTGRKLPQRCRPVRWVSMLELRAILATNSDLVVIDLRPSGPRTPFPIPAAHVTRADVNELDEILRWLPENRSAAFYGASGLCVSMIEGSASLRGSAPLYLLQSEPRRVEVA